LPQSSEAEHQESVRFPCLVGSVFPVRNADSRQFRFVPRKSSLLAPNSQQRAVNVIHPVGLAHGQVKVLLR